MNPDSTARDTDPATALADPRGWFSKEVQPHDAQLRAFLRGTYPGVRDVDDVVQESYLRLWRTATRERIQSARAFLFLVARRVALNVLRKDRNAPFAGDAEKEALAVVDDGVSVAEHVARRERVALLADALMSLPTRCREVTLLHKIEGLSQKEIAARLGVSERTVEAHVRHGMTSCRAYLRRRGVLRKEM